MYEEESQRRREEQQQREAALLIQHRWRQFQQAQEEKEVVLAQRSTVAVSGYTTSVAAAAAAAAADAAAENGTGDGVSAEDGLAAPLSSEEQRAALVDEYRQLLAERAALLEQNIACQRVLAKHLAEQRARKGEAESEMALTPEAEQQYWAMVRHVREEKQRVLMKRVAEEESLEQLRAHYQGTIDDAVMQEHNFRQYILDTAQAASFMRSGRSIPTERLQAFIEAEEEQRERIRNARVRYIELKNYAVKLTRSMNEEGQPSEGMYLIDYEQLKIENSNLNEKIEERNEDIAKLRRKVTTTIHVLTHVKEKLECVKKENEQLRQQVSTTEGELNTVRDQLAQTKRRRDGYSRANLRLREKAPLVGSEDLLLDYEQRKATILNTRKHVVELTERHKELVGYAKAQQPVIESLRRALSHYPA